MNKQASTTSRSAEILTTARRQLVEEGLDGFVMRRVADIANMRLGNLQYYYPTRNDLLEAILRAEFDRDVDALATAAVGADARMQLLRCVRFLLDRWLSGNGNVYAAIGPLALTDTRFARLWAEIYEQFYELLGELVQQIDPAASPDQVRLRTVLLTALIDGATVQAYESRKGPSETAVAHEIERLAEAIAMGA